MKTDYGAGNQRQSSSMNGPMQKWILLLRRIIDRYRNPGNLYHKEYRFQLMGDLKDKLILDVGCGDGQNAVLLAELGASVVGVDISPKAIELATIRAEITGLTKKCRFVCSPLETAGDLGGPFDIVWGDAILHHLISEFDTVMEIWFPRHATEDCTYTANR